MVFKLLLMLLNMIIIQSYTRILYIIQFDKLYINNTTIYNYVLYMYIEQSLCYAYIHIHILLSVNNYV